MAILLERFEFPAPLLPNREAELCRLEDRVKEPASLAAPRTARQNLACHADGRKKTALAAAVRLELRASKPGHVFLRDVATVPEAVLFVKGFFARALQGVQRYAIMIGCSRCGFVSDV